jgi:adenylate kinase family enzyme
MERIVVLGRGGAGKTTLARRFSEATGAQHICLDEVWRPEWSRANTPEFRLLVEELHAGERWISDGNFAAATFDLRLPRATLIVWVEGSRIGCSWRALVRALKPGDPHHLAGLFDVWSFIWRFDRVNRPRIEAMIAEHGAHVRQRTLRSRAEAAAFLEEFRSDLRRPLR